MICFQKRQSHFKSLYFKSKVMFNMFQIFKRLRSKIHGIRQWWMAKSATEKYEKIRICSRLICELIGIRIFSDMKNYWYTVSCGVCAIIYFSLDFYTIQYYLYRREFVKIIECTYLFGIAIAVRVTSIF